MSLQPPSELLSVEVKGITYLRVNDSIINELREKQGLCTACPAWTGDVPSCNDMRRRVSSMATSCGNASFVPLHEYVAWRLTTSGR